MVAVTLGEAGVVEIGESGICVRPQPVKRRIVDPTGAGDAFSAGFLESWLRLADLQRAAGAGVSLAIQAVSNIGGRPTS